MRWIAISIAAASLCACNLVTGLDNYDKGEGSGQGAGNTGGSGGASGTPDIGVVADFAAGPTGTCMLNSDFQAFCWGLYPGRDGVSYSATPVLVDVPGQVLSMVAGAHHRCVQVGTLADDGEKLETELYCWGDNDRGQLGNGSGSPSLRPTKVQGVDGVVFDRWSTGHSHVCAAQKEGQDLFCWGANNWGQVGDGTGLDAATPVSIPVPDAGAGGGGGGSAGNWNGILSAGLYHSCAIVQRSGIDETYCWGRNDAGQLAQPPATVPFSTEPLLVDDSPSIDAGFDHFDRVFSGGAHTCARGGSAQKPTFCWGANDVGQLGDGTTAPFRAVPQRVDIDTINTIYMGNRHTCASFEVSASVYAVQCWGANDRGQINVEAQELQAAPTPISFDDVASFVSQKGDHSCALTIDKAVYCWGANDFGQLGPASSQPFEREPVLLVPAP